MFEEERSHSLQISASTMAKKGNMLITLLLLALLALVLNLDGGVSEFNGVIVGAILLASRYQSSPRRRFINAQGALLHGGVWYPSFPIWLGSTALIAVLKTGKRIKIELFWRDSLSENDYRLVARLLQHSKRAL